MMMINRRRVMGAEKLPYDAEIEYLESTGTQYIDTGIYGDLNTQVELLAMNTVADRSSTIFGSRENYDKRAFALYNGFDGRLTYSAFCGTNNNTNGMISKVSAIDLQMHNFKLGQSWYIDDVRIGTFSSTQYSTPSTMLIFAWYSSNINEIRYGYAKISYLKILKSNSLVRDFIPVRIGQVGYMYDKVSGQLFGNSGTGSFILGPDV